MPWRDTASSELGLGWCLPSPGPQAHAGLCRHRTSARASARAPSALVSIVWVLFYLGLDFFQLISLVDLTHFLATTSVKSLPTSCSSRCTCKYGQQSLPRLGLASRISFSPCGGLTRQPSVHPSVRPSVICSSTHSVLLQDQLRAGSGLGPHPLELHAQQYMESGLRQFCSGG